MYLTINDFIILFFIYSIIGWFLEIFYRTIKYKKLINPGVLTGPYVPIYGFAGILILQLCFHLQGEDLFLKIIIYILVITFIEYITGEFILSFFNKRYWDYRDNKFNIRGHVCILFSIIWGLIAIIFEYTIMPISIGLLKIIPYYKLILLNYAVVIILCFDFLTTTEAVNKIIFYINYVINNYFINNNKLSLNNLLTAAQDLQNQSQKITNFLVTTNERFTNIHNKNQRKIKKVINEITLRIEELYEVIKIKIQDI